MSYQATMNAELDKMRANGLSIDGDNAYKRDLLDAVTGALAYGKQRCSPPPAGHWLEPFYDMGKAEADERDAARASLPVGVPDGWIAVTDRMPEKGRPVQVWCDGSDSAGVAWRTGDAWCMPEPQALGYESITHWQPLAAAPTVKAEQVPTPEFVWVRLLEALHDDNGGAFIASTDDYRQAKPALVELIGAGFFKDDAGSLDSDIWEAAAGEQGEAANRFGFSESYAVLSDVLNRVFERPEGAPSLPAAGSAVEEVEVVAVVRPIGLGRVAEPVNADSLYLHCSAGDQLMTVAQHERIVAALSAQQPAQDALERVSVPVPFVRFLLGESEIDGAAFGERHPSMPGQFWWRKQLRALLSHGRGEA